VKKKFFYAFLENSKLNDISFTKKREKIFFAKFSINFLWRIFPSRTFLGEEWTRSKKSQVFNFILSIILLSKIVVARVYKSSIEFQEIS